MKVGIFGRIDLPISLNTIRRIKEMLENAGVEVLLEKSVANAIGNEGVPFQEMNVDYLITVGGDGTILRASLYVDAPIFPIKVGNLGFLTEIGMHEVEKAIHKFLSKEFSIEEREKLDVIYEEEEYSVTNEVAIKGRLTKLNRFIVRIPGEGSHRYRSDGIVVSTPTGSTGYTLSLGGPVIYPQMSAILICPIAPFRDVLRSIVIPSDKEIEIEICENLWFMVLDGQIMREYNSPGEVKIRKSDRKFRFVRFKKVEFLEDINQKFHI